MASHDPIDADKVQAQQWEFLWGDRIPRGAISVVAGRGDQGKGLFAAHVAAEISQHGGHVLYCAAEDDHRKMSKPRLDAAEANLKNVTFWRFSLPADFDQLEQIISQRKTQLVVIDPFAACTTITRRSDRIRMVTNQLTALAETYNVAILVVEHALKKFDKHNPLGVIGGSSSGLPVATRAAFALGIDPEDEDKRILVKLKLNIVDREEGCPMVFDLDTREVQALNPLTREMEAKPFPYLVFDQELDSYDVARLFVKNTEGTVGRPPEKRAAASEWLTHYLLAAGGPVLAGKVTEDAKHANMNARTLRRAAQDMGVVKAGGGPAITWDLPPELKPKPKPPETTDWDAALGDLIDDGGDGNGNDA